MNAVYTVEIIDAEMLPGYARNVPEGEPISMTFIGKGVAKTLQGAIREAKKAVKASERRVRDEYLAKYGWDNATPIFWGMTATKNGKKLFSK